MSDLQTQVANARGWRQTTQSPADGGSPLRVIVPGWDATDSVKWLSRITVVDCPFTGHFELLDYRLAALLVRPNSVSKPALGVATGDVTVSGGFEMVRCARDGVTAAQE